MFALFNAPFHSDQLRVRDFEPQKHHQEILRITPPTFNIPPQKSPNTTKKIRQVFPTPQRTPPKKTIHQLNFWGFLLKSEFQNTGCLGYIGDEILPSCTGVISWANKRVPGASMWPFYPRSLDHLSFERVTIPCQKGHKELPGFQDDKNLSTKHFLWRCLDPHNPKHQTSGGMTGGFWMCRGSQ